MDLLVNFPKGQPHVRFVDVLFSLHHIDPASVQHFMSKSTWNGVYKPKRIPLKIESSDTSGTRLHVSVSMVPRALVVQRCNNALGVHHPTSRVCRHSGTVRARTLKTEGTLITNNFENDRSLVKVLNNP